MSAARVANPRPPPGPRPPPASPAAHGGGAVGDVRPESKVRLLFVALLSLQMVLLVLRWRMGDGHGALLMFSVCIVGVLAISVGRGPVDSTYGGYYALMAFMSGLLDLNLALESIAFVEIGQRRAGGKSELALLAKPMELTSCAALQLSTSFLVCLLCKEADDDDDDDDEAESAVPFLTHEQARVYNSVLRHSEPPLAGPAGSERAKVNAFFSGSSHKVP